MSLFLPCVPPFCPRVVVAGLASAAPAPHCTGLVQDSSRGEVFSELSHYTNCLGTAKIDGHLIGLWSRALQGSTGKCYVSKQSIRYPFTCLLGEQFTGQTPGQCQALKT